MTHDLGTAVLLHHPMTEGQQGDDAIDPRAPVCWLTINISAKAMSARSSSHPFNIWRRMVTLFAVMGLCQFMRPSLCRSLGAPVRSRGSVEATWTSWRAAFCDLPMRPVIPASEMVVNCRP